MTAKPQQRPLLTIPTIWAIAGGCVMVIGAFFTGLVNLTLIWQTKSTVSVVSKDLAKVEGQVNSKATAAQEREEALREQVQMLRETLQNQRATAALLAQAVATRQENPPTPEAPPE